MCYEYYHKCTYCNQTYICKLNNYLCPTINNDANRNMCASCEAKEAEEFKAMNEEEESDD